MLSGRLGSREADSRCSQRGPVRDPPACAPWDKPGTTGHRTGQRRVPPSAALSCGPWTRGPARPGPRLTHRTPPAGSCAPPAPLRSCSSSAPGRCPPPPGRRRPPWPPRPGPGTAENGSACRTSAAGGAVRLEPPGQPKRRERACRSRPRLYKSWAGDAPTPPPRRARRPPRACAPPRRLIGRDAEGPALSAARSEETRRPARSRPGLARVRARARTRTALPRL